MLPRYPRDSSLPMCTDRTIIGEKRRLRPPFLNKLREKLGAFTITMPADRLSPGKNEQTISEKITLGHTHTFAITTFTMRPAQFIGYLESISEHAFINRGQLRCHCPRAFYFHSWPSRALSLSRLYEHLRHCRFLFIIFIPLCPLFSFRNVNENLRLFVTANFSFSSNDVAALLLQAPVRKVKSRKTCNSMELHI